VGDSIVIELTGKPAARYLRLFDQPVPDVPDGGFCVPLEARIIRIHHDKLIADYQIITGRDSDLEQLVTVTVSFDRQDLTAASIYRTPQRKAGETKGDRRAYGRASGQRVYSGMPRSARVAPVGMVFMESTAVSGGRSCF
jgi:hypothetical protein